MRGFSRLLDKIAGKNTSPTKITKNNEITVQSTTGFVFILLTQRSFAQISVLSNTVLVV
jgi:hypothetical protein